jgi:NAD-dependent dihydropyrimidine dehydrogenase PreA subunit
MKLKYLKNVVSLEYNSDKCIGCGMCRDVCPHGVFEIYNKKAEIIDKNSCIECGACSMNCPTEAIEVDAGVGCAAAVIYSWFTGKSPTCGDDNSDCCG